MSIIVLIVALLCRPNYSVNRPSIFFLENSVLNLQLIDLLDRGSETQITLSLISLFFLTFYRLFYGSFI